MVSATVHASSVCVCVSKRVSAKSALGSRIYRGRKKPVALVVNPHQSGDSRAMLATANSGKTFHSEIRLIQPRGPRLVNFSHRFPSPPLFFFFEIRTEAPPPPPPPLNCKFDPDRSCSRQDRASIPSPRRIFSFSLYVCVYPSICAIDRWKLIGGWKGLAWLTSGRQ